LEPFLDHPLASVQLEQISTYIDLLLRWNARINLTAIRNPEEIVTRHFGESFFMARHLFPDSLTNCHPERSESKDPYSSTASASIDAVSAESKLRRLRGVGAAHRNPEPSRGSLDPYFIDKLAASHQNQGSAELGARRSQLIRVLDIGSGAGFPALPLKIWAPGIHLTLIEANHKKAAFLKEASRALTLTDINVLTERAETLAERQGSECPRADVVTFRAVEKFDQILPFATTFLAPAGRLALLIGAAQVSKLNPLPALTWQNINVPKSQNRVLSIGQLS
ncbi:MAG: 16S rRNA (guanine(527)-N(7))-methyltransferase RsmG, partial [Terriglobales bacterium]